MRRTWVTHVVLLVRSIDECERLSFLFSSCRWSIHRQQRPLRQQVKGHRKRSNPMRRNFIFAGLVGCGAIARPSRLFPYSPGNYDFAANSPGLCMQACSASGYAYASVSAGRFCFCGASSATISALNATSTTLCAVIQCAGDGTLWCGDTDYELVYTSIGVIDVSVYCFSCSDPSIHCF